MAVPVVLVLSKADPLAAEIQLSFAGRTVSICQVLAVLLVFPQEYRIPTEERQASTEVPLVSDVPLFLYVL